MNNDPLPPIGSSDWIKTPAALSILDCSWKFIMKLADSGMLTRRQLPRGVNYFLRSEVEELAAKSIRRARRQTEEPAVA